MVGGYAIVTATPALGITPARHLLRDQRRCWDVQTTRESISRRTDQYYRSGLEGGGTQQQEVNDEIQNV